MDRSRILTFFGRIGSGPDWDLVSDRIRIAMSRDCQLKYAIMLCHKFEHIMYQV